MHFQGLLHPPGVFSFQDGPEDPLLHFPSSFIQGAGRELMLPRKPQSYQCSQQLHPALQSNTPKQGGV